MQVYTQVHRRYRSVHAYCRERSKREREKEDWRRGDTFGKYTIATVVHPWRTILSGAEVSWFLSICISLRIRMVCGNVIHRILCLLARDSKEAERWIKTRKLCGGEEELENVYVYKRSRMKIVVIPNGDFICDIYTWRRAIYIRINVNT